LENPGVDGRIILKLIYKKCDGDVECINMAQDRDRCQAFVNEVMNFRFSLNMGNFLTSRQSVRFSRGLCSMELTGVLSDWRCKRKAEELIA
jgi:hypothetical protein